MKDLKRDFSTEKQFRVVTVNTKNGWSDFSDTDAPGNRIAKTKAEVAKYNKTGILPHPRMEGCGNLEDLVFVTTEISQWEKASS